MRLIDADALVSALNNGRLKEQTGRAVPFNAVPFNAGVAFALTMVEDAPTIDAVPVVRCKDCKGSEVFQNDSSGVMARYCKAFTLKRMVADDDYCSYGERKDDE